MCEEKRGKIFVNKAGNAVNSGTIDKFSNENQEDFAFFNLCKWFCKAFYQKVSKP
jgi:hypothetical protein